MAAFSAQGHLKQLQTGDFSDFKIVCRNKEFRVHRVVICAESSFFDRLCKGKFKVDLSEDDPDTVSRVLLYLYTKGCSYELPTGIGFATPNYDATPSAEIAARIPETPIALKPAPGLQPRNIPTGRVFGAPQPGLSEAEVQKRLEAHVAVYVCADKFGIVALKQKACQYFMDLAFSAGIAYYDKQFFSRVLRCIYENTMVEEDTQDKPMGRRGLREEVTLRLLVSPDSSLWNMSVISEFEPMAHRVAVVKNIEIADVREKSTTTTNELAASRLQATTAEQSKATLRTKIGELEGEIAKIAEKKINVRKAAIRNCKRQQDMLMGRLSAWLSRPQACGNCRVVAGTGWEISVTQGGQTVNITCPYCRVKTTASV